MAEHTTDRGVRFGVITIQNVAWATMVRRWRRLEALGFDAVWLADHFANPRHPRQPWFEAWTLLAALATRTSTIRIGTLVSPVTLRQPALLARSAMTVDHISGGRLELGLGAGGAAIDHAMAGVRPWTPAERAGRFGELVEIVDRMLRDEETTYHGRYYRVDQAIMRPRPVQRPRPPITIGGFGDAVLRVAARHADAWNASNFAIRARAGAGLAADVLFERLRERLARLEAICGEIGRDARGLRRSVALAGAAEPVWTSIERVNDLVERYCRIGVDEFIVHWPRDAEQHRVMEAVAAEMLPALRRTVTDP